jgi:hypothetical protein
VKQPQVGYSGNQVAHTIPLETTQANGFVAAGVEKCWSRFDHCGSEMHDVFIVISEGADGEHIARTVYAADHDDARQTHQENYADEPIVAVQQ